jgi:KaiC/GvpD/RAD55 family RecA-like ATPase
MKQITNEEKGRTAILPDLDLETIKENPEIYHQGMQINYIESADNGKGFFVSKTANKTIEDALKLPPQKKLFREFFFENELACLFSDYGTGKSILAVQIADALTGGDNSFIKCETDPETVLYFDFELSDKQFQTRYTETDKFYRFSERLIRVEINPDADIPKGTTFEDHILNEIEKIVLEKEAKTLIVDNITYLRQDNEKAKDALFLMKNLKNLKSKHCLTVLCLAHTPKRDQSRPIGKNDLAGSKMLANFFDSIFAIGESNKQGGFKYLKQIKTRNSEMIYHSENIMLCEIEKIGSCLKFILNGFGVEADHLKQMTNKDSAELDQSILKLHKDKPFLSNNSIAKELGTNHTRVGRVLKKYDAEK